MVFLDEPTTGMDPVTRRQVWDVIERAKAGRVIILTTHSMEEAGELATQTFTMVNYSYSHQVHTYVLLSFAHILSLAAAVIPPLTSTPTPTLIPSHSLPHARLPLTRHPR